MGKIVIDQEKCKGCQLCIDACPKHLIRLSESTNSFGYQVTEVDENGECTGCALCALVCPDLAIEVYR